MVLIAGLVACLVGLVIKSLPDRHPTIPGKPVSQASVQPVQAARTPVARTPVAAANVAATDGIQELLNRWVASTRKKDANEQAACYAPIVDQFYRWQKVSSSRILREKQRQFTQVGKVRRFDISNVRVNRNAADKAMSLDKT